LIGGLVKKINRYLVQIWCVHAHTTINILFVHMAFNWKEKLYLDNEVLFDKK